jgi:hypothetical protein
VTTTLRVERRCSLSWDALVGDHKTRFCSHCSRTVYNLDAMAAPEIESLRQANPAGFCATYLGPPDAPFVMPSGIGRDERNRGATAAALLLAASLSGCSAGCPSSEKGTASQRTVVPAPKSPGVTPTQGGSQCTKVAASPTPPVTLSEEQRERLRALGYVAG